MPPNHRERHRINQTRRATIQGDRPGREARTALFTANPPVFVLLIDERDMRRVVSHRARLGQPLPEGFDRVGGDVLYDLDVDVHSRGP
jgi:hypothetical protein